MLKENWPFLAALVLAAGVLAVDLVLPLGVASAVPYVLPVAVTFWSRSTAQTLAVALLCSVLTIVGYLGSPLGGIPWVVMANRAFAIFAIWVAAAFVLLHERARREIALHEHERAEAEFFRQLLTTSPDPILVTDEAGRIALINEQAERAFGYGKDELLGRDIEVLVPERLRDLHRRHRAGYMAAPRVRPMGSGMELTALCKDGREITVEINLAPVMVGETVHITAAVRDVSERKRAEHERERLMRELKTTNQDLERFAYIASHDLQEPLRTIASFTQLLEKRYRSRLDGDADEFIHFIVDGAKRMQDLINDLLAYSRVQRQRRSPAPCNLEELVRVVEQSLAVAIREAGAEITCAALPTVTGDRTQLTMLLQNLISNALKFRGDRPPRIGITAEEGDGEWRVRVRDNGIGIEARYHERVFELFQRLHGRERYPGTGLGLAICKRVVERHGGRIWIEAGPAPGTVVCFTIPFEPVPEAGAPDERETRAVARSR